MWEVLSFADKPYKGLSKAKVVFSDGGGDDKPYKGFEQYKADYNDYNRDGDVDRKKTKVKERLKTSNYMMEPPTNYLRHNKKSWTAAYQVVMMMVMMISSRR